VLLVGEGAEAFAHAQGLPRIAPAKLITERARARWLAGRAATHGTIGAVAVDPGGHFAAATSTGGTAGKLQGRVGDTPLIGAGTYADDRLGAISCTGLGEFIIRTTLARQLLQRLEAGLSPADAARVSLGEITRLGGEAGFIFIAPSGVVKCATTCERMACAWIDPMGTEGTGYRFDAGIRPPEQK
jgi:isoaspartyl peptidase/L-asparaginase-like protein (Ntn-hydrolase superfamily)